MSYSVGQRDRRGSDRQTIQCPVLCKVPGRRGTEVGRGETVNMSSRGLLFNTGLDLRLGAQLQVSISWPAKLDSTRHLKLVAVGRVVRLEAGKAAIEFEKTEFRTMGAAGFAN